MTDKTMTLEQAAEYGWKHASWDLENVLMGVRERHLSQPAERGEAVELEYPEFHAEGMGCGLEDRGITDRYEAMRYGWDEALDRMSEILSNAGPLYTAPRAAVPDGWRIHFVTGSRHRPGDRWEIYDPSGSGGVVNIDYVKEHTVRKLLDALSAATSDGGEQGERHE